MTRSIHIISFTKAGEALGNRLASDLGALGFTAEAVSGRRPSEWAKEHFQTGAVLLFIGAAGIAVRAIAPYVKDKKTDAAVIVMDEKGRFAVPILSGHIGEANHFAEMAAALTGGQAVLTTATDVNDLFAIDVLASRNGMAISDMTKAKSFSSALLVSRKARLVIPEKYADVISFGGVVPEEAEIVVGEADGQVDITHGAATAVISPDAVHAVSGSAGETSQNAVAAPEAAGSCGPLHLIPKCLTVGIGCRRGKEAAEIKAFFEKTMAAAGLDSRAVCSLNSIDLKKDEEGLTALAGDLDVPFKTCPAEALKAVEGDFTASSFVAGTTGVDNVCERAAMAGGAERLILKKTAENGMTLAVGIRRTVISF